MTQASDRRRGRPPGVLPLRLGAAGKLPQARVSGRWRPYRDVRAAFGPWRRVALAAWSMHENSLVVPPRPGTLH